jgi:hypothetical protein
MTGIEPVALFKRVMTDSGFGNHSSSISRQIDVLFVS